MVRGVNDSPTPAQNSWQTLIRGMGAHVNLIPINPVDGSPYSATDAANVSRFQQQLRKSGRQRHRPPPSGQRHQRRLRAAAP